MNCPICQSPSQFNKAHHVNLCMNKNCEIYLKDDVSMFIEPKVIRSTNELIEEIMANFDFDSVYRTMNLLNWTWASSNGVPTLKQIREHAQDYLEQAIFNSQNTNEDYFVSSGGFKASYSNKDNVLELSFILEDWSAD